VRIRYFFPIMYVQYVYIVPEGNVWSQVASLWSSASHKWPCARYYSVFSSNTGSLLICTEYWVSRWWNVWFRCCCGSPEELKLVSDFHRQQLDHRNYCQRSYTMMLLIGSVVDSGVQHDLLSTCRKMHWRDCCLCTEFLMKFFLSVSFRWHFCFYTFFLFSELSLCKYYWYYNVVNQRWLALQAACLVTDHFNNVTCNVLYSCGLVLGKSNSTWQLYISLIMLCNW